MSRQWQLQLLLQRHPQLDSGQGIHPQSVEGYVQIDSVAIRERQRLGHLLGQDADQAWLQLLRAESIERSAQGVGAAPRGRYVGSSRISSDLARAVRFEGSQNVGQQRAC